MDGIIVIAHFNDLIARDEERVRAMLETSAPVGYALSST